jgi:hypothetical protein
MSFLVPSLRGVFNPSILNHRARGCRAALLAAWMQARASFNAHGANHAKSPRQQPREPVIWMTAEGVG